jgi:hypothetical protein
MVTSVKEGLEDLERARLVSTQISLSSIQDPIMMKI